MCPSSESSDDCSTVCGLKAISGFSRISPETRPIARHHRRAGSPADREPADQPQGPAQEDRLAYRRHARR
jgi:hypothetical protein